MSSPNLPENEVPFFSKMRIADIAYDNFDNLHVLLYARLALRHAERSLNYSYSKNLQLFKLKFASF